MTVLILHAIDSNRQGSFTRPQGVLELSSVERVLDGRVFGPQNNRSVTLASSRVAVLRRLTTF